MSIIIEDCLNQIKTYLSSLPGFTNAVVLAFNEEDFMDKIKGLKTYPGLGIVYEGLHSVPEIGSTGKVGISGQMVISIILISGGTGVLNTDEAKFNAIRNLDRIRSGMMATRSPSMHPWRFLVEAPAQLKNGTIFWAQRWTTPVQMPPANLSWGGPK
jgi:hypothetical protein